MAGTILSNFGIALTDGQKQFDLNLDHWRKAVLVALAAGGGGGGGGAVNLTGINGVAPSVGAGNVGTGVQRMTLAANDPAVAALQIMDDWDETNRAAVNAIEGQVAVAGGSGVVTSNTQRIVLANDYPLPPGENHIGQVGGKTALPATALALSVAGSYASGDYIGPNTTPASFADAVRVSGGTGVLKSLVIADKNSADAAVDLELWLFSATFTVPTDNAAWTCSDTDALNCVGVISLPAAKWHSCGAGKVYCDGDLGLPIKCAATSLFFALVARGTTPTWASGNLQITPGILQD